MSFLTQLDWRFATKKFDTTKKVSDTDLAKIVEAVRKAPTSLGMQTFHVYIVTNPEVRAKLLPVSYGQTQVTDATALLVFCARTDVSSRADQVINTILGVTPEKNSETTASEETKASLKPYSDMMHGSVDKLTPEQAFGWAARQAYIALGFGLAAATELQIDSCPMEGFNNQAVDEILALPVHLKSVVYLAVGYRAEEPAHPKFRFPESELFTKI